VKNGIKKNIAFYIHLFLFILFIFNSIQFYRKGYTKLIEHIKNILIQKEPKKETGNEPKVINNDDVFPAKARNNQSILKLKTPKNFRHSFRDGIAQDDIDYSDNYSNNQKSISKLKMLKIKYLQRSKQRSIHNYKPKPHELETDIDSSLSMNEYILPFVSLNNAIDEISKSIGNLEKLKILCLTENFISSLPDEIGYLKSLEEFYFNINEVKTLPESISNLVNLRIMNGEKNKIENIPTNIGNLSKLERLNLSFNLITEIPKSICELKNLEYADFNFNKTEYNVKLEIFCNK